MIIDIHSHILPEIDDGSKSISMSIEMLTAMKSQGVDFVVASPHFYYKKHDFESFLRRREEAYANLKNALINFGLEEGVAIPKIILGSETAYAFEIEKFKPLNQLCIENTNTLLLEMPFREWSIEEINAIASMIYSRNLTIVIAHLERYLQMQKSDTVKALLNLPVFIQINSQSLLPMFGRNALLKLFKEGTAHILASDAHNMSDRMPNLDAGRNIIAKKLGNIKLEEIDETTKKIINL